MSLNNILLEVVNKISLSKNEEAVIRKKTKNIVNILKNEGLEVKVGGSFAKGTVVRNTKQDVDIFVVLRDGKIEKVKDILSKKLNNLLVIHGSRDYLKIEDDGISFEIIPIVKLPKNKEATNITDFSLSHVRYIKNRISKNKNLISEIRITKAFCIAQNCYGAESYIGGFSGYAIELLICHYGSFLKFLKNIRKDRVIDIEKFFKNKNEIFREINQSKLTSPLILIDPTYKYRNVCAGLSEETFCSFLKSVNSFLKKPSIDFFNKKEFIEEEFFSGQSGDNIIGYKINFSTDHQDGDIAGTKMKKAFRFISNELGRKEQLMVKKEFIYTGGQSAVGYMIIKIKDKIEVIGPPIDMTKAVNQFKKSHKNVFKRGKFFVTEEIVSTDLIFKNSRNSVDSMGVSFDVTKRLR